MAKEPLGKLIPQNRGGTIFASLPFGNRGTLMVPRFAMPFLLDQRADLTKSRVADRLDIRRERIDQAIDSLKKPKKSIFVYSRKRRHDYIRDVAAPYVVSFCRDDEYSRLDTNQGILEVAVAGKKEPEKIHKRIWKVCGKVANHALFLESSHFAAFQRERPGATIGFDIFNRLLCPAVKKPTPKSCVDERISSVEHFMAALLPFLRRKEVKEQLTRFQGSGGLTYDALYDVLRKAGAHRLIRSVCCDAVEYPQLHHNADERCPKVIPFLCTHGKGDLRCQACGISNILSFAIDLRIWIQRR